MKMTEQDYIKQIELITAERDGLIVKLHQTRTQLKCFKKKAESARHWSQSIQSAVNQSGRAVFIDNLARKIYCGREVTRVGCDLCNAGGVFKYSMDENCERCAGTGYIYVGVTE